jgi:hypothetical protein
MLSKPAMRVGLRVFVIVGAAGVGKTRYAYERSVRQGGVWMSCASNLQWFDGYNGEANVIIDDFRGGAEYADLLRVLDIYPLKVPVKGGFVDWTPTTIWITSNLHPDEWYPNLPDISPLSRRINRVARIPLGWGPTEWERVREFLETQFQ